MAIVVLQGKVRTDAGKGVARKSRMRGNIPGIMYGEGEPSVAFEAKKDDFLALIHTVSGENVVVDLKLEGDASDRKAIIREIQRDPLSGRILHFDLQHISLTEKVTVDVPIVVVGVPTGVKDFGGILEHILREVRVECLPTEIPPKVEIDVTSLKIGDSVHVGDLVMQNVTILMDPERPVVTVVPPTAEEVPAEAAAPEVAEPELIGKEKEAEGEEAGEKEKEKPKDKTK
ncbi:MAG: 50S ribosomal protein L25, partial [Candidatus Eisenbacteria bacterium]|nr:50S ribosomal protein L25 [Candidatus Eisenbacteria bacterium]